VVVMGERAVAAAAHLRAYGVRSEIAFQGNIKNGLKYANKIGAAWAVLANAESFALKNLGDGTQSDESLDAIVARLTHG